MTLVMHQPAVVSMEPIGPPPSFSARKTGSANLPGRIDLPSNPLTTKFNNSQGNAAAPQNSQPSITNLLTPPSNISGDSLSPISSGSNSATNSASQGLPPYTPTGYWHPSGTGLTPYINGTSGSTPPSWTGSNSQFPPPKGMFSPSLNSMLQKSGNSPSSAETVQPPSYDLGALPPFPSSISQASSLPPMAAHNQAPAMSYMGPQSTQQPMQSPPAPAEGYIPRPLPTPNTYYGGQSSGPQHSHYPAYPSSTSPMTQSPVPRLSPINHAAQQSVYGRPYPPYHMQGQMMGSQVSMVGMAPPFNSGAITTAHMQQFQYPGAAPQNDRPFKCDQCPQSFNRNHDLKRHKRIHLAVKPFPCGHCEKSFSRKDALKRHILVKGCGKAMSDANRKNQDESSDKEESSDEGSPSQS